MAVYNCWPALLLCWYAAGCGHLEAQNLHLIDSLNNEAWKLHDVDSERSLNLANQLLHLSQSHGYPAGEADSRSTLGYLYCIEGQYDRGFMEYREALILRRGLGDSCKVAGVYNNLSMFHNDRGAYPEAVAAGMYAIHVLEQLVEHTDPGSADFRPNQFYLGNSYLSLSNVYSDFQDDSLALHYARNGYRTLLKTSDRLAVASAAYSCANRFYDLWDGRDAFRAYADSAAFFYRNALHYFLQPDQNDLERVLDQDIGSTYHNMAVLEMGRKNYPVADTLLKQAENTYQNIHDDLIRDDGLFYVWTSMGKWQIEAGKDYEKSLSYLQKANDLAENGNIDQSGQTELLKLLAIAYEGTGQKDSAIVCHKAIAELNDRLFKDNQTRFNQNVRQFIERLLGEERTRSASLKGEKDLLTITNFALLLLLALLGLIGWNIFQASKRNKKAADQKIRELVHSLDTRFLEGMETERDEIARVLHDDLGGQSVALIWMAESLQEQLPEASEAAGLATTLHRRLKDFSDFIRSMSHRLSTIPVERSGLIPAIQELCADISRTGRIHAQFEIRDLSGPIELKSEIGLLRIIQELLSNTLKYASAHNIQIELNGRKQHLELRYTDDGTGFNIGKPAIPRKGIGLDTICRRVENMGGTLVTESRSGKGMRATILIPLQEGQNPA